jgi:phosphodiesterase/alkaline phosphatase D-like protein
MSTTKIQLNWTDQSSNEAGFYIERSPNGTTFKQIATVGANITTFLNKGLTPSTNYFYRVRAYAGTTKSAYSNTASAITLSTVVAPSNLQTTSISTSQISLTWSDNSSDETGFKIQRSTDGVTFKDVKTVTANTKSWTNSGLVTGTTYYYRVRAYRTLNGFTDFSSYSNTASATTK